MITDKQFDSLAQNAHMLGGSCAVFGCDALWGVRGKWAGAALIFVFALVKEFWYDERYETPEVRGSSAEDFIFYCVGILAALMALSFA